MSIYAVWGTPQAGKTEIAIALAKTLARYGRVVSLISAQNFAELSGKLDISDIEGRGIVAAISSNDGVNKNAIEVNKEKGMFVIAATPFDSAIDLIFTKDQAIRLLTAAAQSFQDVVVDCTSTLQNAITGEALTRADKVIIPICGNLSAKYWHDANESVLSLIKKKEAAVFVRNCTVKEFDYITLDKTIGCKSKCEIPFCKTMYELMANGMGLMESSKAVRDAVNDLAQEVLYA